MTESSSTAPLTEGLSGGGGPFGGGGGGGGCGGGVGVEEAILTVPFALPPPGLPRLYSVESVGW